jgi:hypothetical protein
MVLRQFVTIEWVWLILPAIILVASTIFLCIAIITSEVHHVGLWKSSPLTLFYHATCIAQDSPHSKSYTQSLNTEDAMREAASNLRARIVKRKDGHIEVG